MSGGASPLSRRASPPGSSARVLEARHLAPRVDAGVGSPRDGERHALLEYLLESGAQLTLDRSQPGLGRPAAEGAAVVGERQPYDQSKPQTSSRKTISVESERRGPSLTIRVYPPERSE